MQKSMYGIPVLFAILGFSFVIIIHECGHFIVAKLCGLAVPIFSLGFGPALLKFFFHNTTFQISLIPLGGYVSFDPASFALISYIKQTSIVLAGILANIILAYILIAFCYQTKHFYINNNQDMKLQTSFSAFWYVLTHMQELSMKTFLKGNEEKAFVGPFGIMSGISESYKENMCVYFLSIALLSLNLALFNVLPLPLLDGGKLVEITIAALFGPQPTLVIFLISIFLFFILMTIIGNIQSKKSEKK